MDPVLYQLHCHLSISSTGENLRSAGVPAPDLRGTPAWSTQEMDGQSMIAASARLLLPTQARRDGDLWNMIFASSQRRPYCQYCFGSTHRLRSSARGPYYMTPQAKDLPGLELHTVFIFSLSIHPCLSELLQ